MIEIDQFVALWQGKLGKVSSTFKQARSPQEYQGAVDAVGENLGFVDNDDQELRFQVAMRK